MRPCAAIKLLCRVAKPIADRGVFRGKAQNVRRSGMSAKDHVRFNAVS